ncbi:MAG: tol-pal system protein YbgF [Gemmatimonadota bacterium]|nr:tol-pal system protein YbgF [Gemmatimonadota bacterium]MDE3012856.1 tol-pal system protein YbgF [Gemmatimonadota bacterium]
MHIMKSTFRMTTVRVLATLAVAVTFSGCAMKGDIRLLQEELRAIAARQDSLVAELRIEAQETQDTLRTQGDQMFDLRGDLNRQLQQINQSLVRIEAIAGQNQRGLTGVRDQLANIRRMPAGPAPGAGGMTATSDSAGTGSGESLIGGGSNPQELYDVAKSQYDRGSLNSASRAFEQFLADHPNNDLAPDAHFFVADILTQQDRPEDAIEAFQEIQELFPTHPRVPQALYRIAEVQIELEDIDAAKVTLERIINTYPDELVAMLARERLDEIG